MIQAAREGEKSDTTSSRGYNFSHGFFVREYPGSFPHNPYTLKTLKIQGSIAGNMVVIGSFLFNRTLRQFLALDDPSSSQGQALLGKLRQGVANYFDRIIEAIPQAPADHADMLKELCREYQGAESEERLLALLSEDDTQLRIAAREVLRGASRISPALLFRRLQDRPETAAEVIDLIEEHQERLPPELMIKNALRLQGSNGKRLLEIAIQQSARVDMERLSIDPATIEALDLKIVLIHFLRAVDNPQAAALLMQMTADESRIILIEALKALKHLGCSFDPSPLVQRIPEMGEVDQQLAIEVLRKQSRAETLAVLAPLAAGQSDALRQEVTDIVIGHAGNQALRNYLEALAEQDWWGRDQALKCLLSRGSDELFNAASHLFHHDNEFVRGAADQLAASRSVKTTDLEQISEGVFHEDWQVRDRVIRQLGRSGNVSALTLLGQVQKKYPESTITVLKAVRDLGFSKGLEIAVRALKSKEAAIQREALHTAGAIATERHADKLRNVIIKAVSHLQATVRDTAREVVEDLTHRFGLPPLKLDEDNLFETRLLRIEERRRVLEAQTSRETPLPNQAGVLDKTQVVSFQNIEELEHGDQWMGRYRIVREIGRGAMGRVMLAHDDAVGEQIVLKFMHPELTADGNARERFLRELKYSRKISHPNVIRIHDFLIENGLSAISMEYFESTGLDELIRQDSLDLERSLKILHQVCGGLWEAHRQKVIHRDIKPSNILVNRQSVAKVVDFGIASATTGHEMTLTRTGMIIGTPAYLSPERARGEEADHRSDIYALGIIAYSMFSGELPYKGEPMSLLYQHIEGKATPLHHLDRSIPVDVSRWVQKMMAADIGERFQTMKDARDTIAGLM